MAGLGYGRARVWKVTVRNSLKKKKEAFELIFFLFFLLVLPLLFRSLLVPLTCVPVITPMSGKVPGGCTAAPGSSSGAA